jgi:N-formylglutamate amidohydrolase
MPVRNFPLPFSIVEPPKGESPVVVEVPHAGLSVDAQTLARLIASAHALGRDADLYVDELYADAPSHGATLLCATMSRYVCDLNRSESDVDARSVEGAPAQPRAPRGVVWQLTGEGQDALEAPLPREEFERRLKAYYRPYHEALTQLVQRKIGTFGYVVVVAAHSMPSVGRNAQGRDAVRADVVPGTRGRTSAAPSIVHAVDAHARAAGFSVAHDDPYQGGFTTRHYGRPDLNCHVVQVELARRLYMDERTLAKSSNFDRMRAWCGALVARMTERKP